MKFKMKDHRLFRK